MSRSINYAFYAVMAALLATLPASGGEFPYVAYVLEGETYIRSGPGNEHYPTGQLPAGYALEVYRHDAEGWCAIRPPEGSFSLAAAHELRALDERTAEVIGQGAVARVGSNLGEQRTAVQVLLQRGERVELRQPLAGDQRWVKIAPPAGEFRWIAARRLSRTPPVESAPPMVLGASGWQSQGESSSASSQPRDSAGGSFWPASGPVTHAGGISASHAPGRAQAPGQPESVQNEFGRPRTVALDDIEGERLEVVAGSPAAVRLAGHEATTEAGGPPPDDGTAERTTDQPRIRFRGLSVGQTLDPRVAEIELRLSQTVVRPPAEWQLASVREETAALLAAEPSPEVREQLRDVLDRVATFESVQAKYRTVSIAAAPTAGAASARIASAGDATAGLRQAASDVDAPEAVQGPTGSTGEVLARVRSDLGIDDGITPTPGGREAKPATEALYDAVGTLKPVVSRRDQAPRYALVDDHGDVVTFVTAGSDVNLKPLIGRRIGVSGSRGFMPEYRRAHVTASRVTPLEERLVK